MNCPECGHHHSRVTDTHRKGDGIRRYRTCRKCGHKFATLERIETWDPAMGGYTPADEQRPALAPVPDHFVEPTKMVAAAERPNNRRWHPVGVPEGVCQEAAPLLLEWWNESRRLKHKGNAVWSEKAWLASVERVKALAPHQQVALCQAGVEQGWQALKPEYLAGAAARLPQLPRADGRPMPKDPAMLAALESWPKQTA
jgi:hypothetical protein